jgi:hypothetical protein
LIQANQVSAEMRGDLLIISNGANMDNDGQFRYKELMSKRLCLLDHYNKRYKERVSKGSSKALDFTKKAYIFGKDIDEVEDKEKRKRLQRRIHGGRTCKMYRGFIVIFDLNKAITVFPVPNIKSINKEHII